MRITLSDNDGTVLDSFTMDEIGDLNRPLPQTILKDRIVAAIATSRDDTCSYCFKPIDVDMGGTCFECDDKVRRGVM
jgi:hypothetical protein